MIEINLLPGRQTKKAWVKLPDVKSVFAGVTNLWVVAGAGVWIIALGFMGATFFSVQTRRVAVQSRYEEAEAAHRRFRTIVNRKRQAERVRDSLVAELNVIRRIDSDRYVWPHVLDQVAKAVPDLTWLTNIAELPQPPDTGETSLQPPKRINISGETLDVQAYTRFQRNLAASPWMRNVNATSFATTYLEERPLYTFNVQLEFRIADSAYIRTVPLLESVR